MNGTPDRERFSEMWNPRQSLIQLGEAAEDSFTNQQAQEHILIFGSSGAGKTTSSFLPAIVFPMLAAGYGAVLCCAKPGDADVFERCCASAARKADVIRITLHGRHCFDPICYTAAHPAFGGNVEDVINIPSQAMEVLHPGRKTGETYWEAGKDSLLRDLVTPLMLAERPVSLAAMEDLLLSAPKNSEEVHDEEWQQGSLCKLLDRIVDLDLSGTAAADRERCCKSWLKVWPRVPQRSRGVFEASVRGLTDIMLRGPMHDLLSSGRSTIVPELLEEGAIFILDLPTLGGPTNRAAQVMILTAICNYLEKRTGRAQEETRPILIALDECQRIITPDMNRWLQVLRSAAVSVCLATQDLSGMYDALVGGAEARTAIDNLVGNCGTKIFHSVSDPATQDLASRLIGDETDFRANFGGTYSGRGSNMSAGGMEERRPIMEPAYFGIGLRRGGAANDFISDAIVFQNSRVWKATGKPFIKVSFRQRFF